MVPWKTPLSWRARTLALILGVIAAYAGPSVTPADAVIKHKYDTSITEAEPLEELVQPWSLALDSAGNLFVADPDGGALGTGGLDVFGSSNSFITQIGASGEHSGFERGVAVNDATGDVYVANSEPDELRVFKPNVLGEPAKGYKELEPWEGKKTPHKSFGGSEYFTYVAINNSSDVHTGDVYILKAGTGPTVVVVKPGPSGEEGETVQEFSVPGAGHEDGLAVSPITGDVYVASPETGTVDVFNIKGEPQPELELGEASASETPAKSFRPIDVAIDPSTGEVYVVDAANHVVDEFSSRGKYEGQITESEPESGKPTPLVEPLGVAVNVSGDVYVSDGGAVNVYGPEPPSAPKVESDSVSEVTDDSATFDAEIIPGSESTKYRFEYGACASPITCATRAYEHTVPKPDGVLTRDFEADSVSPQVQGLLAGTTYHFRVLAENEISKAEGEPIEGEEQIFTTRGTGEFVLPDARQWEMVSPPEKNGSLFQPIGTEAPIQAAADGAAITYPANAPTESEPRGYVAAQVLSTRGVAGAWESRDLAVPHSAPIGVHPGAGSEYRVFSKDLSLAVVQPFGSFVALSPDASEQTAYLNALQNAAYAPLVTGCPSAGKPCEASVREHANVPEGTVFGVDDAGAGHGCPPDPVCGPEFVGATPDLGHVVLHSKVALTKTTPAAAGGGLYEWSAGKAVGDQLQLISWLPPSEPGGEELPIGGGNVGLPGSGSESANARHAISDDGSRVFWSDEDHLYMRDTVTEKTIQLDVPEPLCPSGDDCGEGAVQPGIPGGEQRRFEGVLHRHTKTYGRRSRVRNPTWNRYRRSRSL